MGILDGVPVYELFEKVSEEGDLKKVNYFFISEGKRFVIKVVDFQYFGIVKGKPIYNLGFGDLVKGGDKVDDMVSTNNGDVYKVFNTILSALPLFLSRYPNAMILVTSSDTRQDFIRQCRSQCQRRCENVCFKQKRRFRIYQKFIARSIESLSKDYVFWVGDFEKYGERDRIIPFSLGLSYNCIYVERRK